MGWLLPDSLALTLPLRPCGVRISGMDYFSWSSAEHFLLPKTLKYGPWKRCQRAFLYVLKVKVTLRPKMTTKRLSEWSITGGNSSSCKDLRTTDDDCIETPRTSYQYQFARTPKDALVVRWSIIWHQFNNGFGLYNRLSPPFLIILLDWLIYREYKCTIVIDHHHHLHHHHLVVPLLEFDFWASCQFLTHHCKPQIMKGGLPSGKDNIITVLLCLLFFFVDRFWFISCIVNKLLIIYGSTYTQTRFNREKRLLG